MELSQIRYFLAVAETLNFTSAAKDCAISQPALSKAINKLEGTLGAKLLDRSSQQVRLTEFGRTMRIHFERIEENRCRAINAARIATQNTIKRLNVGVMCTIGPRRFSQFLGAFYADHPGVEIILHDVIIEVIPELLLSGGLDCVICFRANKYDLRFQAVDLFEEDMVVVFARGHHFDDLAEVSLKEVAASPYLDRLHCEFRDEFLALTRASGLELDVAFRSEREDWILELIQNGHGISVMPKSSAILNNLACRSISNLTSRRKLELVMAKSATVSSTLVAFRDFAQMFDWSKEDDHPP